MTIILILLAAAFIVRWLTKPGLIEVVRIAKAAEAGNTELPVVRRIDSAPKRTTPTYREALTYVIGLRFNGNILVAPTRKQKPEWLTTLTGITSHVLSTGSFKNALAAKTDDQPAAITTARTPAPRATTTRTGGSHRRR